MADKRQPLMFSAAGRKASGKTIETIKFIYQYLQTTNKKKGRKVLIFDVNDEFSSFTFPDPNAGMIKHKIQRILLKDIPQFSASNVIEVRRISPFWDNNTTMSPSEYSDALEIILKYFRNGLLLCEDTNKYVTEHPTKDLYGRLITGRHIGVDIFMHFQGVGAALTPRLLRNTAYLRMHKTLDSVYAYQKQAGEFYEILSIAENIVSKRYEKGVELKNNDRYFNVMVNLETSKINGDFTKVEAETAVIDFISTNDYILKRHLKKRDLDGNVIALNENQIYKTVAKGYLTNFFEF
jgi:hypothetical protein